MARLSPGLAKFVFYTKLIGTPLLIGSFIHPMDGVWNAVYDVFMSGEVDASTKALVGFIYAVGFIVLFFTAFKNLGWWGLGVLFAGTGIVMWFLQDQGLVSFDSRDNFGWAGLITAIVVGYIGVFGANLYRIITGRYATDSHDPDTEPNAD